MLFAPRVLAGFAIAPLTAGAAILLLLLAIAVAEFMESGSIGDLADPIVDTIVWIIVGIVTASAYGAALLIGVPFYLYLRRKGWLRLIDFAIGGLLIGAVAFPVATLVMFGSIADIFDLAPVFWPVGLVGGLLSAIAFWLIARPDRA
jgi:hypothetical protein